MPRKPTKVYVRKKKRKQATQGAIDFAYRQTIETVETPEAEKMRELFKGEDLTGGCVRCAAKLGLAIDGDYVEGIIIGGMPKRRILHAWVEKDGNVYDATTDAVVTKEQWQKAFSAEELHREPGDQAAIRALTQGYKFVSEPEGFSAKDGYMVAEAEETFTVPDNPSAKHWDITTAGVPIWDELMKDPKYFQDRKGMTAEVQWMTPDEYFDLLPKVFAHQYSYDTIKDATDPKKVDKYANLMKQGTKFPMLWIEWWNEDEGQQEGRHRALAAEKAGIEQVPVMIVKRNQPKSDEAVDAVINTLLA
jgi:hypothetical protein